MFDGIQHLEEFHRTGTVTQPCEGHGYPQSRMRVLPPVLSHTGRIAHDVARVGARVVKGRGEQEHELLLFPNQMFLYRAHGPHGAVTVAGATNDGPGLRDGIDLVFYAGLGT